MASMDDHNAVYNDDDEDDEDPLNDVVLDEDEEEEDDAVVGSPASSDLGTNSTSSAAAVPLSSSSTAAVPLSSSSAVSVAVLPPSSAPTSGSNPPPPPSPVPHPTAAVAAPTTPVVAMAAPNAIAATPVSERKPIYDSRRLFQRLWTDEDEIELLQGFLDYTAQRGPNWSGHHHDTTAFYDQIKSKLELDCNKNQLVEKLRRLKRKYRNVVNRISSGKEFVFKSPHDQASFEISRKIWSNSISNRPEFDDDDQNPNPKSATPVTANLNSAGDHRTPGAAFGIDINSPDKMMMMMMNMGTPNNRPRKRSRVKMEENSSRNVNSGGFEAVNATPVGPVQGIVKETVKSYLSPLLKQLVDNAVCQSGIGFGGVVGGAKGIGSVALNAIPMNFPGANLGNCGEIVEERWRKQQILELEVYSKRLEIVQEQIKLALEDLRMRGN